MNRICWACDPDMSKGYPVHESGCSGDIKQEFLNEAIKQELGLLAPCLIDGHEAREDALIELREYLGTVYKVKPIAHEVDYRGVPTVPITLKLCARCGVVYEEKAK